MSPGNRYEKYDEYGLRHTPRHLARSTDASKIHILRSMLFDFDWLQTKLNRLDQNALIADYDLIPGDQDVQLLQEALRLSLHILAQDKNQLASQLLGRLLDFRQSGIQDLLEKVKSSQKGTWLRPVAQNFQAPGQSLTFTLAGHTDTIEKWMLTPDGNRLISASKRSIKVWDLSQGMELFTVAFDRESTTAFSSDGWRAVSTSHQKIDAAMAPDGGLPDSSSNEIVVWDLKDGSQIQKLKRIEKKVHNTYSFYEVMFLTSDGKRAVIKHSDHIFKIWDLEKGTELNTISKFLPYHLAATPDGKRVVAKNYHPDICPELWDLESGTKLVELRDYPGITEVVLTVDGKWAISASENGTLQIWDLDLGIVINKLIGHEAPVKQLAITSDHRRIISASSDGKFIIWNLMSASFMGQYRHRYFKRTAPN